MCGWMCENVLKIGLCPHPVFGNPVSPSEGISAVPQCSVLFCSKLYTNDFAMWHSSAKGNTDN